MFRIGIEKVQKVQTVKHIYFEGIDPFHPKKKIEGSDYVELEHKSKMKFVFYSEDTPNSKKPATYTYFTINNPGGHVKIDIKKDNDSQKLETVIEWPKNGKQKSKDVLPPDNVNVGVKE